ncbi:MAG: efflux RND transporter periplasmic adaptor subunit [Cyanobacteria bacterium P01_F01_bin.150]
MVTEDPDTANKGLHNSAPVVDSPQVLKRWRLMMAGAIALGIGLTVGLPNVDFLGKTAHAEPEETKADLLTVATIQIQPESSYSMTRTYTGAVASLRTSELGFEQGGTLVWVGVDRGDRVTKGTPIARLDTRNLAAERSQLLAQRQQALAVLAELQQGPRQEDINAAQATVQDLENQLELQRIRQSRREYLVEEGAIAREQLDEVAFGADALEDRLNASRSQLQELQTGTRPERIAAQTAAVEQLDARIRNLDITIEKSTILAPFTGVIGERQQDEGTVVSPGQSIVRLVESAQPEVEIGVPPKHLNTLIPGRLQTVTIEEQSYSATIQAILPELDPTTRTRTVVMQLNDGDRANPATIAPGQIARLDLKESIAEMGYWLPTTALIQGEKGLWNVYATITVEPDPNTEAEIVADSLSYQVERRLVEVLHTEGDRVFVRGTLNPDDLIITNGTQKLVPGQRVQQVSRQKAEGRQVTSNK